MFYKRILSTLLSVSFVFLLMFNSASCSSDIPPLNDIGTYSEFSVSFLDVGQGDCIFIRLPDGKNMLIDCGINDYNQENINYIRKYLGEYKVNKIDYFILTHPDVDHIGNATTILNEYVVDKAFIPYVYQELMINFPTFSQVLNLLEQQQIEYEISDIEKFIVASEYTFVFLSPLQLTRNQSSYNTIINSQIPSDKDINNLSPIIYFECFENRFIFTGDAEKEQELLVVENYNNGIYNMYHKKHGINVNLEDVEYLKVSHHGGEDASCNDFLELVNPSNAIISVGNDNFYGHPASETLFRLTEICPNHNLYRTDTNGTIVVYKDNDQIKITSSI